MPRRTRIGFLLLAVTLLAIVSGLRRGATDETQTFRWPVMGTIAQVTVRNRSLSQTDLPALQRVYTRLDERLSAWNPDSELCRLAAAHCTNWLVAASPEVRPCYAAALRLARESGNAFNPRVGARLRELGVSGGGAYSDFDLGAIAKGFAVDVLAETITRRSAGAPPALLLDLGGNLRVVGDGVWRTGVRNPFDKAGPLVGVIALTNGESIATSGNYERFIEQDGVRLSHILDGRTGAPTRGIAAVTVVTPPEYGAVLADGLSTTLFVLGPKDGAAFLARHYPRALALWIPDTPAAPRVILTKEMARRLQHVVWPSETRTQTER
ncbi:MAG: FAD:protein FMN transferase [Kiritimatiellia bacterium]